MRTVINGIVAVAGTALSFLFGRWDLPLAVLIAFMAADYLSGVLLAVSQKKLSSAVGFRGLAKKASILLVVVIGVLLDRLVNSGAWAFRTLTAYFYIANEGISLMENAAALGIPIPEKIKDILAQLQQK